MAITRIKNSTIGNKTPKYNDVLAGLPFRPIIGTATDGGNGTSASVAFTGNNVANGTITYTALSSPGSFTGTGTASPITVSGLTAGTAYTFQVKAGNSLGDSAYSAASNSVTPVTPTSFESIATATGTGSSDTITFSSIPQTYKHLQLRVIGKRTGTGFTETSAQITFNGDVTSNYTRHGLLGNTTTASANATAPAASILVQNAFLPSDTAYANMHGVSIIDIYDYTSTTKNKTVRAISGYDTNGEVNLPGRLVLNSGLWFKTPEAITSITLKTSSGLQFWTTTSQFALYGIKGA